MISHAYDFSKNILDKYSDIFPAEFIASVNKGVSWLCSHNNITYQTSVMVTSDRVLYNTPSSSILRLGLINIHAPLSGLTYYEIENIEVYQDDISGNTIFEIKAKYDTPIGISVTLIPIIYFDPEYVSIRRDDLSKYIPVEELAKQDK